jgi:predicted nucleotidyltransferase
MKATQILEDRRTEIEALCRHYGVTRLRLFGSSVGDHWDPESSDFDFLAEFEEPPDGINLFHQFFGLQVALENLLGRKVDLVDWKVATKPHFREQAESSAVTWYAV